MRASKKQKKLISKNRRAYHEYEIIDRYEAGLVLQGTEVKSLRQGHAVLQEGYVAIKDDEAWLYQVHIPEYSHGNRENHIPHRRRKLLLSHREIQKIKRKITQQGFTAFILELYFKGPYIKAEIAVGRGKKMHDKRNSEKEKSARRELRKY